MNYKTILEKLGLVENVDFLIIYSHFQMKAKVREVEFTKIK